MDDMDFDWGDWLGDISSGLDLSGGDTSWLDTVDWGSMMDTLDFSNLDLSNVYGDISAGGLGGLEDIVITGEAPTDLSGFDLESADQVYAGSDLGTGLTYYPGEGYGTGEAGGILGAEDLVGPRGDTNIFGFVDPYEIDGLQGSRDEDTALVGTDTGQEDVVITGKRTTDTDDDDDDENPPVVCPPGSERKVPQPDGSVWTYNCKGELIDKSGPKSTDCPPNSNKKTTLPNGTVVVTDCKGRVVSITEAGGKTVTPPGGNDFAKWAALLGGLLGLMNKPSGGPAGYQGSIPKYMATRGPSRSPTEGGRRPGGAGIGSLTGGVSFTPVGAAGGGLMDLAQGGKTRPARYLRGGTDGMADKIQTDIDGKQPARVSHGEFVIPADVVSHLGNGNSDAGADVLYDMMAKVRKARTGTQKQGKQINPRKYTPV